MLSLDQGHVLFFYTLPFSAVTIYAVLFLQLPTMIQVHPGAEAVVARHWQP